MKIQKNIIKKSKKYKKNQKNVKFKKWDPSRFRSGPFWLLRQSSLYYNFFGLFFWVRSQACSPLHHGIHT